MPVSSRQEHNWLQANSFDRSAHLFESPLPPEVLDRLAAVVEAAQVEPGSAILDVGTGTGVLLPYILLREPGLVVACDLSAEMLRRARARFGHRVQFFQADVIDLPSELGPFDRIFCNGMFGNFYDQGLAIVAMAAMLKLGGRLVISHPLGRGFVHRLHQENPELVPHELPEEEPLRQMLEQVGLALIHFTDQPGFYLTLAETSASKREER